MSKRERVLWLILILASSLWASGIIPAIIPAAAPVAFKIGNGTKFQIAANGAISGDCAQFDAGLNVIGPGTGAGCGGSGPTGGGITTYSGLAGVAITGTVFFPMGGGNPASATESDVDTLIESSTDFSRLGVSLSAALGVGNTIVFTARKNGADQTLTCTITGNVATTCGDVTHTFSAVAGDLIDYKAVVTGTIVVTPVFQFTMQSGTLLAGSVGSGTQFQIGQYATAGSAISGVSVPDCQATGTNHLNRTAATGVWTCGTQTGTIGIITYTAGNWTSTSGAWTAFSMDTIDSDSSGGTIWAVSPNPTRYVATSAGRWTMRINFGTTSSTMGAETGLRYQLNGASTDAAAYTGNVDGVAGGASQFGSTYHLADRTFNLAANDYIEVFYFVSTSRTITGGKQNTAVTFYKELW